MANGRSAEEYANALRNAKGFVSVAARQLGVSRKTVHAAINKYASVADARDDARESTKDMAEGQLFKLINSGNVAAIIFYLKTQAKDRGYIERQEVTGKDGTNLMEGLVINIGDSDQTD